MKNYDQPSNKNWSEKEIGVPVKSGGEIDMIRLLWKVSIIRDYPKSLLFCHPEDPARRPYAST